MPAGRGSQHRGWRSRAPAPAAPGHPASGAAPAGGWRCAPRLPLQLGFIHHHPHIGVESSEVARPAPSRAAVAAHRLAAYHLIQGAHNHRLGRQGIGVVVIDLAAPQHMHRDGHPQQLHHRPALHRDLFGEGADRRRFPLLHPGQLEGKRRKAGCSLEVAGGVQVGRWAGGSSLAMGRRWRTRSTLSATKSMSGFYAVAA